MRTFINRPVPFKLTHIETLSKDMVEGADVWPLAPDEETVFLAVERQRLEAVVSRCEEVQDCANRRRFLLVRRNDALVIWSYNVPIAARREAWPDAGARLL